MELLKGFFYMFECVCARVYIYRLSCLVLYVTDSCEIHFSAGPWLVEVLQRGQHDTAIRCLQAMQFIILKLCAIPGSKWLIGINFLSEWLQAVFCWRHRCCGKRCKFCTIHRSQQFSGQTNWVELNLEVCGWIFYFWHILCIFFRWLWISTQPEMVSISGVQDHVTRCSFLYAI